MKYLGAFTATALIALLCVSLRAQSATAPSLDARGLVQEILNQVLPILRDPNVSKADRREKVRQIAYQHIDFQTMSRLTLARHWRDLSPSQQAQFVDEFQKHLTATYAHTTDSYTDEDLTVSGDRAEPNGDWTVQTRIVGKNPDDGKEQIIKVDYRLRQRDGQWKVIDVTVDNVSLVANFRSQFQEIMSNGGYEELIKLLREKNAGDEK